MQEIQRFALEHIYCAPSQDYQYRFSLVRVTKDNYPVSRTVNVYNDIRVLPRPTGRFHVYVVGNIPVTSLNLLSKKRNWIRDKWYNVQDDMNARNFIIQLYNKEGRSIPRSNIYYSCSHNDGLIFAIESDHLIDKLFNIEEDCYVRFYSNEYFSGDIFQSTNSPVGIYCDSRVVLSNQDKVDLQNKISQLESKGGKTLVYVNGYYADSVTLHIPINSLVEIVYDNSIISKEIYPISSLRTFESKKDNKLKYLLFRSHLLNSIQYEDDTEVYITGKVGYLTKGLYYYQHKDYSFNNVTDKDFAIYTQFTNTQAQMLSELIGGGISDKSITLLTRRSAGERKLIYSSLKLHELYKLPDTTEFEVMSNTGYTLHELRAEQLENSSYFKIMSAVSLKDITSDLATEAVGYNGISYYYANSPIKIGNDRTVKVPKLYQEESIAYEYDTQGKLLKYSESTGPLYTTDSAARHVEFIQGKKQEYPSLLYRTNEPISLRASEYRILIAQYEGSIRISSWEDITESNVCTYINDTVTVNDSDLKRVRVFYFDRPIVQDLKLPYVDGVLIFPITVWEDRGNGYQNHLLDLPYENIEVFLNNHRLTYKVDFFLDFPYIGICNKGYIDYTKSEQDIHVRLTGYNLDKEKINQREIRGFVSHGVLTRNNYYDIRDDRVFSTYINGKIVDRSELKFSENDSVIRVDSPINGLPYTMTEHIVSIKPITGTSTLPYLQSNDELNSKISALYNIVYPEPKVPPFNVIENHYYLYSTVVSKVIHDLLDGNISASLYTKPYNDTLINELLSTHYKRELKLDPVKEDYPPNIIKIHPHYGNDTIAVNIYQYRFISNLVRILTNGQPDKINLSGYLTINEETVELTTEEPTKPGGIVVL